jgi:hypothetical protein
LVSFCGRSVLSRLRRLESVLLVDEPEKVFDVVLFDPVAGGLFGHSHIVYHLKEQRNEVFVCSVDEEVELMRVKYEDFGHRFFGQGEELSFPDFLERFDYMGPKAFAEQRKEVVKKLRAEPNGVVFLRASQSRLLQKRTCDG